MYKAMKKRMLVKTMDVFKAGKRHVDEGHHPEVKKPRNLIIGSCTGTFLLPRLACSS